MVDNNRLGYYWKNASLSNYVTTDAVFLLRGSFLRLDLTSSEGTKACLITNHTMVRFVKYHPNISKKKIGKKDPF